MHFPSRVAIVVLAAVVLAAVAVPPAIRAWRKYRVAHLPVAELMPWFAEHAVQDAATRGIQLDYSTDSIQQVEKILGMLHESYIADPSSLKPNSYAIVYGAYIGEAIRRNDPVCKGKSDCRWDRDHKVVGSNSYPLHWRHEVFPTAWCYKRIVDGEEDNVWLKYKMLGDEPPGGYFKR